MKRAFSAVQMVEDLQDAILSFPMIESRGKEDIFMLREFEAGRYLLDRFEFDAGFPEVIPVFLFSGFPLLIDQIPPRGVVRHDKKFLFQFEGEKLRRPPDCRPDNAVPLEIVIQHGSHRPYSARNPAYVSHDVSRQSFIKGHAVDKIVGIFADRPVHEINELDKSFEASEKPPVPGGLRIGVIDIRVDVIRAEPIHPDIGFLVEVRCQNEIHPMAPLDQFAPWVENPWGMGDLILFLAGKDILYRTWHPRDI
ncbi:MAG: hypothetical protein LGR52_01100 [Candidatus Thiosymbion ectosymbiont of Robbea hypermnestra]|nr:hypothetical protein [Candidatus Thiosymbion ectosymbiont of Robbea hypermnestra]